MTNYSSTSLELVEGRADWPHGADELRNVDVFYARTRRRYEILNTFCVMQLPLQINISWL